MRGLLAAFVRGLPLDARSRRALDEALLDWAHETARANTLAGRCVVEARSVMSLGRALASVVACDVSELPNLSLVRRLALVGLLPMVFLSVVGNGFPRLLTGSSMLVWIDSVVTDSVALLPGWLPMALFYVVARRAPDCRLPVLGVAGLGFVVGGALVLWIAAWSAPSGLASLPQWWMFVAALGPASIGAALVVVGDAVHDWSPRPRRLALASAPGVYLLVLTFVSGAAQAVAGSPYSGHFASKLMMVYGLRFDQFRPVVVVNAVADTLLAAALVVVTSILVGRARRTSAADEPGTV